MKLDVFRADGTSIHKPIIDSKWPCITRRTNPPEFLSGCVVFSWVTVNVLKNWLNRSHNVSCPNIWAPDSLATCKCTAMENGSHIGQTDLQTVYSWKSPCHWPRTTTLVEATDLRHRKFGHRGMALGLAGNAEKAAANMCWGDSCHFSFELSEAGAGNGWQRGMLSKEIPRASLSQGSSLPIPNH